MNTWQIIIIATLGTLFAVEIVTRIIKAIKAAKTKRKIKNAVEAALKETLEKINKELAEK